MARSIPRRDTELKMGDLERLTGVPRSTIQHYVRLGLIPAPRKVGPRLFLFDAKHVDALQRVRRLRAEQKLSLADIRSHTRARRPAQRAEHEPPADARRSAIIEVATRLFAERGYTDVRLIDVARALGVSKAALYRSFDSKEALLVECIDRIRFEVVPQSVRDRVGEQLDVDGRARFRVVTALQHFATYRALTHLLIGVGIGPDRALAQRARAALHRMVTNIVPDLRAAVDAGLYRDADLELHAYVLWGAMMGLGDFRAFVRADPIDDVATAYRDMILHGTRPATAR